MARYDYEWVAEVIAEDEGIVPEFFEKDKATEAKEYGDEELKDADVIRIDYALVKNYLDADGYMDDREYAYVKDGQLPAEFPDGSKVPQKYLKMAKKVFKEV